MLFKAGRVAVKDISDFQHFDRLNRQNIRRRDLDFGKHVAGELSRSTTLVFDTYYCPIKDMCLETHGF